MREVRLNRPGEMTLVDCDEPPAPAAGEVLVAVRRVGICGTDLHAYGGRQNYFSYPRVLGHELAVEVIEVGDGVANVTAGDACALLPYMSCGTCGGCSHGRPNCCERIAVMGVTVDGGLRERMLVPHASLVPDPAFTYDQLVLVETLGIGWHAVARAALRPTDSVLILGAGPIGLGVAQAARLRTDTVVIADIAPQRVEFARAAGLTAVPAGDAVAELVREANRGRLPTVVFDATGNRASMEAALALTDHGGTVVFVGHTTGDITIHNPTFHAREIDLRASRNATLLDWTGVMSAVRDGRLDATSWINHRTTLERIVTELPLVAADPGSVVKSVVDLDRAVG